MAEQCPSIEFDLTIFKNEQKPTIVTGKCFEYYNKCITIKRLLASLSYYSVLDKDNNDIFCDFMLSVYGPQIYDDYFHLTKYHQNQLKQIRNMLGSTKCELSSCNFANRHYRVYTTSSNNINYNLYMEVMDSLHFYIYHLEETGLRSKKEEREEIKDSDERKEGKNEYFDKNFSRLIEQTKRTRDAVNRFSRVSDNKFNISVDNKNNIQQQLNEVTDDNDDAKTYLDALYSHLNSKSVKDPLISTVKQIIIEQEYDSESLDIDVEIFVNCGTSNIAIELENDVVNEIVNYFQISKSML